MQAHGQTKHDILKSQSPVNFWVWVGTVADPCTMRVR